MILVSLPMILDGLYSIDRPCLSGEHLESCSSTFLPSTNTSCLVLFSVPPRYDVIMIFSARPQRAKLPTPFCPNVSAFRLALSEVLILDPIFNDVNISSSRFVGIPRPLSTTLMNPVRSSNSM